jgi:hypothetical protein
MMNSFRRALVALLIVSLTGIGMPLPAHAGMIGADAVAPAAASAARERVATLLQRADIQAQLQAYGVSAAQAQARVDALSDAEALQLAERIDSLPAAGDAGGLIWLVLVVFLVLLLTDILGLTKVFPFTRSVR